MTGSGRWCNLTKSSFGKRGGFQMVQLDKLHFRVSSSVFVSSSGPWNPIVIADPRPWLLLYDASYLRVLSTLSTADQNSLISASDAAKKHCTGSSFNFSREKRSLRSTVQGDRLSDTASTNAGPELTLNFSHTVAVLYCRVVQCWHLFPHRSYSVET